jgi:hypothetical protein
MMLELGLKTFVECGCKEGRTTGHILKTVPDSKVIAIDPWVVQESNGDPKRETYEKWDFAQIEKEFWENIGEHKDRVSMQRDTSTNTAAYLNRPRFLDSGVANKPIQFDDTFDMVFIDALHDYPSVKADIEAWWPLVRDGGVIAFHDFNHKWPSVQRAIADSFDLMDVGIGSDSVAFVVKHG